MSVHDEVNSLINKAQIYENKTFNQFLKENENFIPNYLWEQYQDQFKWMFYESGILQCRFCQEAYKRFGSQMERDEWTEVNEYSYRVFNKENLILILKIHDFSENHTCSVNLLNSDLESLHSIEIVESDRSGDLFINETNNISESLSDEMLPLPIITSSKSSSCWSHHIAHYPWLYLKHNNPGCRFCEEAFKISTEMSATKWTDPTPTFEINCVDRPNRALRRHQLSKNHQRAIEILNENPINDEINKISNGKFLGIFRKERWKYIKRKFSWLYYKSGNYHCMYCEHSNENPYILNELENDSNNNSEIAKLRYFNRHQSTGAHKAAKEKFHSNKSITLEILDDQIDNPILVENTLNSVNYEINCELWRKLTDKYPWVIGENGKYYGCKVCQNASKICSSFSNPNLWTQGMIPFTIITTYEHLRKKLYSHNLNKTHILGVNLENPLNNGNNGFAIENIPKTSTDDSLLIPDEISFNKFLTDEVINSIHDSTYDLI